jgi:precorrin-3B C17-methyltransferase
MRSSGNVGGRNGSPVDQQTEKPEGDPGRRPFRLEIIGLGSGGLNGITLAAQKALKTAQAVYGYCLYLEQAKPHIKKARLYSSGMTNEMRRAEEAIDSALSGRRTAVVSGGDAGVYAMAGVVFEVIAARGIELGREEGQLRVKIIPGVPALVAGAALFGSPLANDFCAVSLSNLLTPWEVIEKRLHLAAQGGFVIGLYNPKSKGRDWQLARAAEILLEHLPPETPVGVASRIGRPGQTLSLIALSGLAQAPADMQTTIIIGNQSSFLCQGFLVTPRGYVDKYGPEGKRSAKKKTKNAVGEVLDQ